MIVPLRFMVIAAAVIAAASLEAAVPKYVFLFIGDGMGVPQRRFADDFSKKVYGKPLAMDQLPFSALTRTSSANAQITDSAAAATAIACGEKTNNRYSGVDPEGAALKSCALIAKEAGRKVGIITTVPITHATPAGFYAHRMNRGDTDGISEDLIDSGFDFFAGGGLSTRDRDHYYDAAAKAGFLVLRGELAKDRFLALKRIGAPLLASFAHGSMTSVIDRSEDISGREPTLAEMVSQATRLLDSDSGFFIMAEGGLIDWAGHANDPATNLREVLALDEAVTVALRFQERHPDETLVIVTGDHETGGMTMGSAGVGNSLRAELTTNQTISVGVFDGNIRRMIEQKKGEITFEEVKPVVGKSFGFAFDGGEDDPMRLDEAELASLEKAFAHDVEFCRAKVEENAAYDGEKRYIFGAACRRVISAKCGVSWSSGGHTAAPVLTTAKGAGAERFTGTMENVDISRIIKSFLQ